MNSARIFASRNHIISWINQILTIQMTKIQQLGSGIIYCLLLDAGYPQRVPISKLKWYANTQVDFIYNFKILQTSFVHLGIDKKIEIQKLIKAKYQDNLDFIQWLKWYLQPRIDQRQYNAVIRRQYRQVYLNFSEHKILRIPAESIYKGNQKYLVVNKNKEKINKKLKKTYKINDQFLQIFQCKTEQSDNQNEMQQQKCNKNIKQKKKMLKTASNFRPKNSKIFQIETQNMKDDEEIQQNKENAYLSINHILNENNQRQTVHCMYSSPKQVKKFFFPERFSERLKKRIDFINGLQCSIKRQEDQLKDNNFSKYKEQTQQILIDENQQTQ